MALLNEINVRANETAHMRSIITEGEQLVSEIEQFLKENKVSFNLKEAIGRSFSAPGEEVVKDPGNMGDVMSELGQESDKMAAVKSKLIAMADQLHTLKDNAQRAALFKKITVYANKAGIDPQEIFEPTNESADSTPGYQSKMDRVNKGEAKYPNRGKGRKLSKDEKDSFFGKAKKSS